MKILREGRRAESRIKQILFFVMHQFIGTLGVVGAAPFLTGFTFDVLQLFGLSVPMRSLHWILTETPYYPVQIGLALALGWLLGHLLRHRSMLWVWVLPFAILGLAFATLGSVTALPPQARLSHFFGWSCRPERHCLDQLWTTLPFYAAAAYSVGAFLAGKIGRTNKHKINASSTNPAV